MKRKEKFKKGIKKAAISVSLAIGPILVMYAAGQEGGLYTYMQIIGTLCMCGSLIFGFLAIKEILDGFFDKSNE
ncbi:MAG: hypothetical protein CMP56_04820 [Flavobacteriales bacterium]|nr:hypothetical protein [Flavobacteriales bacterium]|tara:strand:- start:64 stop:285 length:222 start_codon:yes stop_codon:yes gene_type:complete